MSEAAESGQALVKGHVTFVGGGPGDPNLLTLAAVQALSEASVVLLDDESLLPLLDHPMVNLPRDCTVSSFAGPEQSPAPLGARVQVIREAVAEGDTVVRLITGDPFLDGGVAAEAAECANAGVGLEIIPGISTLTAIPEYAGVPLGDSEVQLINATDPQLGDGSTWAATGTLLISTLVEHLSTVYAQALGSARRDDEPVLLVVRGASTSQASQVTTLGKMVRAARGMDPWAPIHVVVGSVVADQSRGSLDWFESKPLFGWRVLVPRTKEQASPLVDRLRTWGANADEVPTISVEPPRTPQQMDKAVRGLVEGRYEWVAFTSVNAVRAIREKFDEYGLDVRAFSGLRVAAVGSTTAAALRSWGIRPDLVPKHEQSAAGLAAEFPVFDELLDPINRVFLPRADIATDVLVSGLTDLGWEVEDVTAYRTVRAAPPPAQTREAIKTGQFDAVVFTSSSTVRNLVGIAGKPHKLTVIAAIGPQTAKTCQEHGLRVDVLAPEPSALELVDALAQFAHQRRLGMQERGEVVVRPSEKRRRRRAQPTSA
ncbi:uroporphyrinogen-III synthase [Luteococcus sanguinis]|uniref:Uroporphyrinogen-III synthase n=1 Tax=Luteococcus sanguinis TaxID=174038 RepID=A0ABW1X3F8_9ACTN